MPDSWDGKSFLESFKEEKEEGRDHLVVSNCAWACQRAVRWDDYLMIRTYHSGFKNYPDIMLYNVKDDPHELNNLAEEKPELVALAMTKLEGWNTDEMRLSQRTVDPMWIVMREGGPLHARFTSESYGHYLERLKQTGREKYIPELEKTEEPVGFMASLS